MKNCLYLLPVAVLSGCASVPDAKINYRHAIGNIEATAVVTIACRVSDMGKDKKDTADDKYEVVIGATTEMAITHKADTSDDALKFIPLRNFDSALSSPTFAVQLTEDGRLRSINTMSVGAGDAVVEGALAIIDALKSNPTPDDNKTQSLCRKVHARSPMTNAVTLTFNGDVDFTTSAQLSPNPASALFYNEIEKEFGLVQAFATPQGSNYDPIVKADDTGKFKNGIEVRQPVPVKVEVFVGNPAAGQSTSATGSISVSDTTHSVALRGKAGVTVVPFNKPPIFGTQTFMLSLSESGAITNLSYSATGGTQAAVGATSNILEALQPSTAAEQAAALDAQADRIAQQERLTRCQADASTCPF